MNLSALRQFFLRTMGAAAGPARLTTGQRRPGRLIAAGLCALSLAGCSLPIQAPHPQQTWRLDTPKVASEPVLISGKPQQITLLLRAINPVQELDSPAMMYSRAPQVLAPYRDSRWLAPPAEMIGDALSQSLASQPWVAGVVRTGGPVRVQLALSCGLEKLEHDISGAQGVAHLAMDCLWLNPSTRSIEAHWRFDQTTPLTHNAAADFAAGAQQLLNQAAAQIVQQTRVLASSATMTSKEDTN